MNNTLRRWSLFFSTISVSVALAVLLGWTFHIEFLKRPIPELTTMNPTSAVCFVLCGACFFIVYFNWITLRWLAFSCAAVCAFIAVLRIIGNVEPSIIQVDRILFIDSIRLEESDELRNRMSSNGAINFILTSVSLLLFARREKKIISAQVLAVLIGLIAWLAVLGYAYRVPEFYGLLSYLPMAIHTAVCFILLSLALLFLYPQQGIPRELFADQLGGRMARRLFPILLLAPFILGYLRLLAHWYNLISTEFGVSLLIVSITMLFSFVIYVSIVLLNRQDIKQKAQAGELSHLNSSLKEVNEEIAAGNEEFISLNEELNAANEELTMMNEALELANKKINEQAQIIISQKEEELTRYRENLDIIFRSTWEEILLLDSEGKIVLFNNALEKFIIEATGKKPMTGNYLWDITTPERSDASRSLFADALNGQSVTTEAAIKTKEGIKVHELRYQPIYEEEKVKYVMLISLDVTDRKQQEKNIRDSEAKTRENEERFRAIIENSEDFFVISKEDGIATFISSNVEKVLGYPREELVKEAFNIIPPDADNNFLLVLKLATQRPGVLIPVAQCVRHKEGKLIWLEGTVINLLSIPGVNGFVTTFRDVSQRRKGEEEKNELLRQLINRNSDLLQFSFIASHNLRGPVASMLGLLNLFKRESLDKESGYLLSLINQSVTRLDTVIRDLSFILDMRNEEIHSKEWVGIGEMVDEIKKKLAIQIAESKAEISVNDKEADTFHTIRSYLNSILHNLISNAIKYRSPLRHPVITITTFKTEYSVGFRIQDNGIGIDLEKFRDKVFMLYQRFHLEVEGKGLGLYMVKSQTQSLNGYVDLKSEPGIGTEFTIVFNDPPATDQL